MEHLKDIAWCKDCSKVISISHEIPLVRKQQQPEFSFYATFQIKSVIDIFIMYFLYIFLSTVRLNLQWLTYIKLCFLKINCLLENETTTWIFLKMMMGNDFSIHNTRKDTEKIILGFLAAIPVSNSRFSLKIPFKTGITRGNLRSFECGYLNFIQREMLWSTQARF